MACTNSDWLATLHSHQPFLAGAKKKSEFRTRVAALLLFPTNYHTLQLLDGVKCTNFLGFKHGSKY